jgi:hypothetical protein
VIDAEVVLGVVLVPLRSGWIAGAQEMPLLRLLLLQHLLMLQLHGSSTETWRGGGPPPSPSSFKGGGGSRKGGGFIQSISSKEPPPPQGEKGFVLNGYYTETQNACKCMYLLVCVLWPGVYFVVVANM